MRKVKQGHSLFDLLQKEEEAKVNYILKIKILRVIV